MRHFPLHSVLRRVGFFCLVPVILLLTACGDLPRSFQGNPGGNAPMLSLPPTARLIVPPPANARLSEEGARYLAENLADALAARELPVVFGRPRTEDWRLNITAETRGRNTVPSYVINNAEGEMMGTVEGQPIPTVDWAHGRERTLNAAIAVATPKIVTMLARIEAVRRANDPAIMTGRGPTRVALTGVFGAPGDGNTALAQKMRDFLGRNGLVVQDTATGADWTVVGRIEMAVGAEPNQQRVEIQWVIADKAGRERGRVLQLNEIPAGSLNRHWGDVAYVVAEEASGGVRDVIQRQQAP